MMRICKDFKCKEYGVTCNSCKNEYCGCNPTCEKCKYYKKSCGGSFIKK